MEIYRSAPEGPLDREKIAAEALALIDEEGLEGFSMRRLGARLGVEAMSIYHHFPAKADVLDGVADALAAQLAPPAGKTWRAKLADSARRYRALAIEHPSAFMLLTTRRAGGPNAFAAYESILAVLHEAGFSGDKLAKAFRLIGYYVGGAGHAEIATRGAEAVARRNEQLPHAATAYPLMAGATRHLTVSKLDSVFEFGLNLILDGLAAELE